MYVDINMRKFMAKIKKKIIYKLIHNFNLYIYLLNNKINLIYIFIK